MMDDYSSTYDYKDIIDTSLENRGLRVSFSVITSECMESDWSFARDLAAKGHEFINHSWSHTSPKEWTDHATIALQIDSSQAMIERNIPNNRCLFFAFPYDDRLDPVIDSLRIRKYIGARGGWFRKLNADQIDPFKCHFDGYSPSKFIYQSLNEWVNSAIIGGSWAIREVHNIIDCGYEPVPLEEFLDHLDFCKKKIEDGELWMAPVQEVVQYIMERNNFSVSVINVDSTRLEFEINTDAETINPSSLIENSFYNYPLTILLNLPDEHVTSSLEISQGEKRLDYFYESQDSVRFDVLPWGENIRVEFLSVTKTPVITADTPTRFQLNQNYPNPVSSTTRIPVIIPSECRTNVSIYNLHGQKIHTLADETLLQGKHDLLWDIRDIPANIYNGVFLYKMQTPEYSETKRLIIQR